jgi:hypothetical protein
VSAVSLRRAEPRDLDFLLELMTHEEVEPFLAVIRPRDRRACSPRSSARRPSRRSSAAL